MDNDVLIESIDLTPVSIPYRWPVHWAYGSLIAGDHVLIECRLSDGTVGLAEGIPRMSIYGESPASISSVIAEVIAPRLVGKSIWDPSLVGLIHSGVIANNVARGAMEQVIWCARAKSLGVPVRRLIGGEDAPLPVTWMLSLRSLDEMLDDTRVAVEAGYTSIKVKGGTDAAFDIEVYRTIRDAFPDIDAYIDANQGYDWEQAERVATALRPHGLRFLEEPMEIHDPLRAKLWEKTGVALVGDESVTTVPEVWRQVTSGSVQGVSIKISRTGVRGSQQIGAIAAAAGIGIVVGTQGESALGTYLASEIASTLPKGSLITTELCHAEFFSGQIVSTDTRVERGAIRLTAGSDALRLDETQLAAFRTEALA